MSSIGVIVGRFQVNDLHDGHKRLFNYVRSKHPVVVCFLGVPSTVGTRRNPLDFFNRKVMVQESFPDVMVLALPDQPNDALWSHELDKRIGEIAPLGEVKLYGGRDSFVPHYKGRYEAEKLNITANAKSGTDLREDTASRVLSSSEFRAGIIYATQNRYPAAIQCVDIAILDKQEGPRLLLAQKAGETLWRFVGGHVSPTDWDLETAAKRETREETGLELESVEYIGSHRIDDWRWKREEDKIITALFAGYNSMGAARAADDIVNVKWFYPGGKYELHAPEVVHECNIEAAHRPLFKMLLKYLGMETNEPDTTDGLIQADTLEAVPAENLESLFVP